MNEQIDSLVSDIARLEEIKRNTNAMIKSKAINLIELLLKLIFKPHVEFDNDNQFTIVYDGGRHPEYQANPFSTVESVYLNDKKQLLIDTEDATCISVLECSVDEIVLISERLYAQIQKDYGLKC